MSRWTLIFIVFVGLGCASNKPREAQRPPVAAYEPTEASALAFESPLTPRYPLEGLARDTRRPSAFLGYDEGVMEFYSVGVSDRQSNDPWDDNYERWSVSAKTAVRYR